MALDIGTLVAKVRVDDDDFEKKSKGWSQAGGTLASAFGNLASNAISSAASALQQYMGEAMEASDATDKFKKTLEFAGLDTSQIDALVASTQRYADETVYSLSDIQNITAQLTANSIPGADGLAMALGNLNAIAGGNAETFGRVGSVLTQTAGAGKLTTENWNQLAEAIPGASGALQNALLEAGAYTGNFRDAMAKGEITAEEFNAAIQKVGMDPIAVEAAKSVETFEGALGGAEAAIQTKLVAALDAVKPVLTGFINGFSDFVTNIEAWTPVLAGVGAAILIGIAPALWAAVTATWAWTAALLANPMTWIILAVAALVAAIVWLIMNWDTAVAWITEVWGGFMSWLTEVTDGFVAWWNGIWEAVGQFFTDLWNNITSWVQGVWDGFINWIISVIVGYLVFWINTWNQVGQFFTGLWDSIVAWVTGVWDGFINWIVSVIVGFVITWSNVWNQVKTAAVDIWTGLISWFQSIPGQILGVFSGAATWLYNIGRDIVQGLWNGLKSIWESVSSWFQETFGGIIDTVAGIFGIASPSKVFYGFGVNIGEGMVNGLAAMEPRVFEGFESMVEVPDIPVVSVVGDSRFNSTSGSTTFTGEDRWRELTSQFADLADAVRSARPIEVNANDPELVATVVGEHLR